MTGTKAAERLRIERDLLGDLLDDARRAVLAGDLEAELLARHVLSWPPLAGRLERMGPGLVHPRDSSAAKRVLAGLLRQG
ncbi:hypothetical protein ACU6VJ_03670 [Sphaerotilus sulfidivorans]|nr:hypothetical protein CQA4T8M7_37680 [Sphaerotilus natans]